jgi:AcrR family transcriptional regulator
MRYVRSHGSEQLTMRALAADLGVGTMSLYAHVASKDDLLGAVVDRLLARSWRRASTATDRRFLVSEPAALHVYLNHPVSTPAALARMEAMTAVLEEAGIEGAEAASAYAAIHTYTLGFAALEAARTRWQPPAQAVDDLTSQLARYTSPEHFARGVHYLLDGIARPPRR